MYYEVEAVQRVQRGGSNDYYVLVHAWLSFFHVEIGLPPYLTEEFHIRRASSGKRIRRDSRGRFRTRDGRWIDPLTLLDTSRPAPEWEYQLFTVDIREEIREVVETTLESQLVDRWQGDRTGDHTKPMYHHGRRVFQKATARPMRGEGVELTHVRPPGRET